jgi:hypothetical protein
MPRTIAIPAAASGLIDAQDGVVATCQLAEHGLDRGYVHRRLAAGHWRRMFPGVVLTRNGEPTRRQQLVAAHLWAGAESAIDAEDACVWYGLRPVSFRPDLVHVVVPASSGARTRPGLIVRRSIGEIVVAERGLVPYVGKATAVISAGRNARSTDSAIALFSNALQTGLVTVDQLIASRAAVGAKWCDRVDTALLAVGVGVRSPAERDALLLFQRSHVLPSPGLNVWLDLGDSSPPVCVDALWADAGLVNEVNGRRYHAFADRFERTEARRARLVAVGLVVMSCTPTQLRRSGSDVLERLERAYLANQGRGLPPGVSIIDPPTPRAIAC